MGACCQELRIKCPMLNFFLNANLNAILLILNAIYLDLMIFLFSRKLDLIAFFIICNVCNRMEGSVG